MRALSTILSALLVPGLAVTAQAEQFKSKDYAIDVETVAKGLDSPWGLAFLPDVSMLVTEQAGRLRIVQPDGTTSKAIRGVRGVTARGQGGLLGVALDPDFGNNRTIYYCHSEKRSGGGLGTSVTRGQLTADGGALKGVKTIFRQQPAGSSGRHFGCRLVFDRDGALFVTTGDRGNMRDDVQDPATHIGKVIRITTDGKPAPGNPKKSGWQPEIWSMGHRNAQGAFLHPETGRLWTVEHGSAGGDEINVPLKGKNYGWPVISYGTEYSGGKIGVGTHKKGLEQPVYYWDPSIAPSGLSYYTGDKFPKWRGSVFVGALRGQHLARLTVKGEKVVGEERLLGRLDERIRDVVDGPDGYLYLLTDSSNGRILRLKPAD